jgi:glucan biosynthesis protein C
MTGDDMTEQRTRLHHLDGLRAGLMLFGVPYHATLAFAGATWVIVSPDRNPALAVVGETIHVARMPVFFLIAGLFAAWLAGRRGAGRWLAGRCKRLGVPLLFGVLVLGPLQIGLLAAEEPAEPFRAAAATMAANPAFWIQHLWFLVDLLLFCAAYAVALRVPWLVAALDRVTVAVASAARARRMALAFAVIAVLATVAYAAWNVLDLSQRSAQVLSSNVFFYAVFFLTGVLFGRWEGGVEYLSNRPARRLVVMTAVVTVAAVVVAVLRGDLGGRAGDLLVLLEVVLGSAAGVLLARLLFGVFGTWVHREHVAVRWLVDSAIVVYLVHQPIVIALDWAAIALGLDPVVAFLLVTVLALLASLAVYEGVSRVRTLRFLLIGDARPVVNLGRVLRPAEI